MSVGTLGERLLDELGHGLEERRQGADLAQGLGVSEREVRALVSHLRRHGELIGSTSRNGGGFYLIQTREELEATASHMTSRAKDMLVTVSAMRKASARKFGPEVLQLFDLGEVGAS